MKKEFKSINQNLIRSILSLIGVVTVSSSFAQTTAVASAGPSVFSSPLFWVLLCIIILLLIIIMALGNVVVGVAAATQKKNKGNGNILSAAVLGSLLLSSKSGFSQATAVVSTAAPTLSPGVLYVMLSAIALEILIIIVLLNSMQIFVKREPKVVTEEKVQPSILEKLNASVSLEKEKDIMFDHVYDGIRELDNDLPPWWKYGFYVTIIVAVVYLINFHVTKTGDLQIAEYNKSMAAAKQAKEEYARLNANEVTEQNVTMLSDKAEIAKGAEIFKGTCFACHGAMGEGGVGPNLTDKYWLHGGSIGNVFASIKYGWPEKGMKSWQADYSPVQIRAIASYILTLQGTNPPNAKEKQGDLYEDAKSGALSDSLKAALPKDSL